MWQKSSLKPRRWLKTFQRKKGRASYYYSGTRARAMASKLLTESDYDKLAKMDINEIIRFLEENEYRKEVDLIGANASKIQYFEWVLNENFANAVNKIVRFSPADSPLRAYVMRYDVKNIRAVIRGKEKGKTEKDLERMLVPAGILNRKFLETLAKCSDRAKIIAALKNTPYYDVLEKNEKKGLEKLEDALDKFYFEKVLEAARVQEKMLSLIKAEIDAKNVLTLLRLKKEKVSDIKSFFLEGGTLSMEKLEKLAALDNSGILATVKGRAFFKFVPDSAETLDSVEAGLIKFQMLQGVYMLGSYIPSFNTLIGYVISKEREINNIRIIALSKLAKSPESALKIKTKAYLK